MNCGIANLAENLLREDIQELKRALGRSGFDKRSRSLAIGEVLGVRILCVGMGRAIPSEYLPEKGPKRE